MLAIIKGKYTNARDKAQFSVHFQESKKKHDLYCTLESLHCEELRSRKKTKHIRIQCVLHKRATPPFHGIVVVVVIVS